MLRQVLTSVVFCAIALTAANKGCNVMEATCICVGGHLVETPAEIVGMLSTAVESRLASGLDNRTS